MNPVPPPARVHVTGFVSRVTIDGCTVHYTVSGERHYTNCNRIYAVKHLIAMTGLTLAHAILIVNDARERALYAANVKLGNIIGTEV